MDVFLNSTAFQQIGVQPLDPYDDLCTEHEFGSRDFWKCYIMNRSVPYMHPTSTCRMGPNDTVAVVDSKLKYVCNLSSILYFQDSFEFLYCDFNVFILLLLCRVFGAQNIRVVDASVMPFVPSGNTNLPSMLIGAKGAELILSGGR